MSLLSYQLSIKRYQKELGLDDRKFNALDVKYDDINLLKQLQILNPVIAVVASAPPPENTGFYGTFTITNEAGGEMNPISFIAKLAYNNVDITSYIAITSGTTQTLSVPIGSRLPNPSSLLQFKVIFDEGVTSINTEDYTGFAPVNSTENPFTEENTFDLLIDSGQIDDGDLTLIIEVGS
jgi:hypothetical protein